MRSYADGGSVQATAQKLQGMGRNGDTILAHINPEEAALLKRMGGSGKINPNTGLMSFEPGFGSFGSGATGNYGGGSNSGGYQNQGRGSGVTDSRPNPGGGNTGGNNGGNNGGKTDTSGGPGSAPGGDGSKSGSQGMGAGSASSGGKTDTSGGPGSAPGGDGSKTGSQGSGAGSGSIPSGGIADLPAEKATPVVSEVPDVKAIVDKVAKRYGLDPKLFGALVSQESGMNPFPPTGSAGEEGPGQVKPSTFADPGYGVVPGTGDITDPETNLDFAARYFIGRFTHTTGKSVADLNTEENQRAALKTYNAGKDAEKYADYVLGKMNDPNSAYNAAASNPNAGFTVPDPQAVGVSPTDPLKALTPANVPTTPEPKLGMVDQFAHDLPGYIGSALISSVVPPVGLYNLIAGGTNLVTGEKTLRSTADMINDAYYGTGTAAPTDSGVIGGYGPSGGKITNTDPMQTYKEMYGGSDKPLLGIESLDRSPLLPEIDPSVPTAPLFEYDYSKFGIKGKPFTEYDYSKFGIKGE